VDGLVGEGGTNGRQLVTVRRKRRSRGVRRRIRRTKRMVVKKMYNAKNNKRKNKEGRKK
jgi:hypothetical protein